MRNIPNRIYLQVDPEKENPKFFDEMAEVTWCVDKIYDNDIPYYRHKNSSRVEPEVIKPTPNWYLVLQGLYSYKATYERLEKDNLLKDYELHEYEVITEAIEELNKAL